MFDSWSQSSRRAAAGRVLVALIGAVGCLAAVAYAASTPDHGGVRQHVEGPAWVAAPLAPSWRPGSPRPLRPRITRHPAKTSLSTSVSFRYVSRQAQASFQCKLYPGAAPALALRDLPVNQDACQNAQFPLAFSGEARG